MNWDEIEGNWKQFKGKVKEKWGQLTDDEIDQISGRRTSSSASSSRGTDTRRSRPSGNSSRPRAAGVSRPAGPK